MKQPIIEMLNMQSELNNATNGLDWRSGHTQLGKVIDWKRCIYMETAELIDSYPWKHWKAVDAPTDIENVKVELVDIWHFLLSLGLEHFEIKVVSELLNQYANDYQNSKAEYNLRVIDQVKVHERLMFMSLQKEPMTQIKFEKLARAFFDSCGVVNLSFNELYQIYMAKNVLNTFRQDHGYKEGSYIKTWNGKEDNVVMCEIIESMNDFSGETLYSKLEEHYPNKA